MSVYVDDARNPYGRMIMCHMIADSRLELFTMANTIGLKQTWLQGRGTAREHFDVCISTRRKAVKLGAIKITVRELIERCWVRAERILSGQGCCCAGPRPCGLCDCCLLPPGIEVAHQLKNKLTVRFPVSS